MSLPLRTKLLLAVTPAVVVPAICAAAAVTLPILAVGTLLALAGTVFAVVALTAPFERLKRVADECRHQADLGTVEGPAWGTDGTGPVAATISDLFEKLQSTEDSRRALEASYRSAVQETAKALGSISPDGQYRTEPDGLTPWPEANGLLRSSIQKAAQEVNTSYRKAVLYNSFLNDLTEPVAIVDSSSRIVSWNAAAAKLYPSKDIRKKRTEIGELFASTVPKPQILDGETKVSGRADVLIWLHTSNGGSCEAIAANEENTPIAVSILPSQHRKAAGFTTIALRDLTADKQSEVHSRLQHRKLLGQRLCLLVDNEAKPSLQAIRTQAALLTQAAKQTGQREKFVPKVQRMLEELNRQEVVIDLLGWLGRLTKTFGTTVEADELKLLDVVETVGERLQPAINDRSNTLQISGDAGWFVADADWMSTLVTGILMHANQSCDKGTICVKLMRRSIPGQRSEIGEILVTYSARPLDDDQIGDIREPFRRSESSAFESTGTGGFLLGLAVANRIAGLMGQELDFGNDGPTQLIRVSLPTRERGSQSSISTFDSNSIANAQGAEAGDVLEGWDIGGAQAEISAESEDVLDTPLPKGTGETPTEPGEVVMVDDTVGGWFGNN